jgi:hypothetical protein
MWIDVTPMREEGKPLPARQRGAHVRLGRLKVTEAHDAAVHRVVRTACLYSFRLEPLMNRSAT